MKLVSAVEFALDGIARPTSAIALRTTTLDHKTGDHTVKGESVIKALPGEFYKIGNCAGGISLIEGNLHVALLGKDFCSKHAMIFAVKIGRRNEE
jgi:hypothetical protein